MLTDISSIKNIFQLGQAWIPMVMNERITLNLSQFSQLQNRPIIPESVVCKRITSYLPVIDPSSPLPLTNVNTFDLAYQKIIWNTVTVSDDAILTTIYLENVDYIIDYVYGTIKRTTSSAIPSASSVYVWYQFFDVMSEDLDYTIDYANGQIKRKDSSIPNDSTVYIDYSYSPVLMTDELILEIIKEAENYLLTKLKSPYTLSSSDEPLKSAATNFSLYLLCLAQSAKELSSSGENSSSISREWISLSSKYLELAKTMFMPYSNVNALLDVPSGGLIQNRFSSSRTKSSSSPTVSPFTRKY